MYYLPAAWRFIRGYDVGPSGLTVYHSVYQTTKLSDSAPPKIYPVSIFVSLGPAPAVAHLLRGVASFFLETSSITGDTPLLFTQLS
jgi:hypothetical protein